MTPTSTYRLQLRPEFGFGDACGVVDYLRDLGVGAVYTSPILEAAPGSTHGYDVTDPTRARAELGGEAGRLALADAVRAAGLGFVVDIVPNHMSVEVPSANPWWSDVLRHGVESTYAHHFDIDWAAGPILIPVLADADAVAQLAVEGDELVYGDHRVPLAPGTGHGTPQDVHARQHYRLVDWRRGNSDLTYRRFFDITTLAAVAVERPEVFDDAHREVLRWVADGDVTGLRIDHPDGLADPGGYLHRLREAAPKAWIVIEKILHPGEQLPRTWPVDGTTGYDALGEIAGTFVDPSADVVFDRLVADLGAPAPFVDVEEDARRLVTDTILVAEVRRAAALLTGVDPAYARTAIAEVMIAFGVYRSYLPEGAEHWGAAVSTARRRRPDLGDTLDALDHQVSENPDGELATRIQQTSGMVVAKGTEDTTFYRFTRFAAANEVGGSPNRLTVSVADFHHAMLRRETDQPATMTTLTTHDTKRSEDTRARMWALAEIADDVASAVTSWTARCGLDEPALDLLAWQTLVGAWPLSDERIVDYLLKAAREAKLRTSWTDPDEEFERAIAAWPARVRATVGDDVEALVGRIKRAGWSNALGQKLVQLASPGVPDVYQGTELWDFSLVDPDNRRPVDYGARRAMLARIEAGELPEIDESGAAKLLLVHRLLTLRRDRPDLFVGYTPVSAAGPGADHVIAFTRHPDLMAIATRLPIGLEAAGGWRDTVLAVAAGTWVDALTGAVVDGGDVALAAVLDRYPVALLVRRP